MLVINQIQVLTDNYVYIITESASKITACVDPSVYDDVVNFLDNNDLKLDYILNTHHHNDHVGGNLKLKEKYGCKIIGSLNDQERVPGIDLFVLVISILLLYIFIKKSFGEKLNSPK